MAASACRRDLGVETPDARRRWNAVERHVDDRRHAAGRRGPRAGLEPFPLRPARFVDVYVRIDQPGQEDTIADVDDARARRAVAVRRDGGNAPVADEDRRGADTAGGHDSLAGDDEFC